MFLPSTVIPSNEIEIKDEKQDNLIDLPMEHYETETESSKTIINNQNDLETGFKTVESSIKSSHEKDSLLKQENQG